MTRQADRATNAAPPTTVPATIETKPAAPGPGPGQALERLTDTARGYAEARSSSNTRKAYASDWAQFSRWCRRKGFDVREPNPQIVGLFLAASASGDGVPRAAVSSIERRLAAITTTYRSAGTPVPRQDRHIMDVMAGIRRTHAHPPRQKEALFAEDILAMCATLPNNLRGYRDRAILLVGFAGGLRRSEITGLDCGLEQTKDGGGWIEILAGGARDRRQPRNRAVLGGDFRTNLRQQDPSARPVVRRQVAS